MKFHYRFNGLFSAVCCLFVCFLAGAETKGIFWKAEFGEGNAYLLGSVHFANEDFYPLADYINEAFEKSPVLMVEMDDQAVTPAEQQQIMSRTVMYSNGGTIQQHLSKETLKVIEKELMALGVPLKSVENFRPGFVMMTAAALQAIKLGYTPEMGIDHHFLNKARGKKPVLQIETFEEQMALLREIPENDAAILETFSRMNENEAIWKGMEQAWMAGDKDMLYRIAIAEPLKESPESRPFFDVLFFNRNFKMAEAVKSCAKQHKTCFVVVGAGHLVGKDSVIDHLNRGEAKTTFY